MKKVFDTFDVKETLVKLNNELNKKGLDVFGPDLLIVYEDKLKLASYHAEGHIEFTMTFELLEKLVPNEIIEEIKNL